MLHDLLHHSRRLMDWSLCARSLRFSISGRRKSKSRVFVIVVGIIFVFVNINKFMIELLQVGIRVSSYSSIPYKGMNTPS